MTSSQQNPKTSRLSDRQHTKEKLAAKPLEASAHHATHQPPITRSDKTSDVLQEAKTTIIRSEGLPNQAILQKEFHTSIYITSSNLTQ
jgi:hypothetical protein